MAGIRSKPSKSGKYRAWFVDQDGKLRHFTGGRSPEATLKQAQRLEAEHRLAREGYVDPALTPFETLAEEYLKWGVAHGGWRGHPWSPVHAATRRRHIRFWQDRLRLVTVGDLTRSQREAERTLQELHQSSLSGKTVQTHRESLRALARWAEKHGYLPDDPLKHLLPFDGTPLCERDILTDDEYGRLLAVCPYHRSLLYRVAAATGLRGNELRNLSEDDLDAATSRIRLRAAVAKARRDQLHYINQSLTEEIKRFAESGVARCLYRKYGICRRPERPLLFVPAACSVSRTFDADLKRAAIRKHRGNGRVVSFHSLRHLYASALFAMGGASVKEAQVLLRHSTPTLSLMRYAKASEGRLAEIAERVGEAFTAPRKIALRLHQGETEAQSPYGQTSFLAPPTGVEPVFSA